MRPYQTVKFIEEVRKREAIWNCNIPEFKDKCIKRHLWDEICPIFRKRFNEADYIQKADIRRSFQNQWRNIKDCYRKHLNNKRKNPGNTDKEYLYAERLRFLDNVFKKLNEGQEDQPNPALAQAVVIKQEETNHLEWAKHMESDSDLDDLEMLNGSDLPYLNDDPLHQLQEHADSSFRAIVDLQTAAGDQYRQAQDSAAEQKTGECGWERENGCLEPPRKKVCPDRVADRHTLTAHRAEQNEDNDDLNFFLSLMPVLRPLPLEEKLKFRMEVMKISIEYHRKYKRSAAAQERMDHNVRFLVVPEAASRQNAQATAAAAQFPTAADPFAASTDKI